MKTAWTAPVCALVMALGMSAAAQNGAAAQTNDSGAQDHPELKTRPADVPPPAPSPNPANDLAPPNAIPEGTRFIVMLKDTLDTKDMEPGRHFKAELREDLTTPSGLVIPKGRTVKGHVATFERGYTGARLLLVMDEIETRHGWVPLVAAVTGVPGDSSIKSTDNEGELSRKGPDKKRVIINAAIGAGVGAVSGAAIGGGKGAAVGAAAGAGLGTGSGFLFRETDLKLDKETNLEIRLVRDLTIPK
jgi:hypothetical protein